MKFRIHATSDGVPIKLEIPAPNPELARKIASRQLAGTGAIIHRVKRIKRHRPAR